MRVTDRLRELVKGPALRLAPTLILPKPFYAREAERLYHHLDALRQRRAIDGYSVPADDMGAGARDVTLAAVLFSLARPSRTKTESTAARAMTEAI